MLRLPLLLALLAASSAAPADEPPPAPRILAVSTAPGSSDAHMGGSLHVSLRKGDVARLRGPDNKPITLVLDGNVIPGVVAMDERGSDDADHLRFVLDRTADNHDAWAPLLGRGRGVGVVVSVQGAVRADPAPTGGTIHFRWWQRNLNWLPAFAIMIIAALALVVPAFTTSMYRDPGTGLAGTPLRFRERGTFSLARCQMGFWFLNVVVAYTAIWAMTGATDAITPSILAIIGIGSGTLLGAALIDQPKRDDLADLRAEQHRLAARQLDLRRLADDVALLSAQLTALPAVDPGRAALEAQLAERQCALADARRERALRDELCSGGLLRDLLTDENGWSFHRVQLVVWTVVLFVLFWSSMVRRFAMPDFDSTLLSLMGISSGTYLGLKLPENSQRPAVTPAAKG